MSLELAGADNPAGGDGVPLAKERICWFVAKPRLIVHQRDRRRRRENRAADRGNPHEKRPGELDRCQDRDSGRELVEGVGNLTSVIGLGENWLLWGNSCRSPPLDPDVTMILIGGHQLGDSPSIGSKMEQYAA